MRGSPGGGLGEGFLTSVLEAPADVAGLDDVAMMGQAIKQRVVILASMKMEAHSPKSRLVVMMMAVRS